LSTFLAAAVAVVGSFIFKVTIPLSESAQQAAPAGLGEVFKTLIGNMVTNPLTSIMNGNYIGILAWAVILGLALRGASDNTKSVLNDLSAGVSKTVSSRKSKLISLCFSLPFSHSI
jgi:serine/threonine transporter